MGAVGHGTEHVTDYESNPPLMTTDNPIFKAPTGASEDRRGEPNDELGTHDQKVGDQRRVDGPLGALLPRHACPPSCGATATNQKAAGSSPAERAIEILQNAGKIAPGDYSGGLWQQ